jgi:sterol desaturase/sphingolipid hydroxylase (fatty acid hydroxylase superfamily)
MGGKRRSGPKKRHRYHVGITSVLRQYCSAAIMPPMDWLLTHQDTIRLLAFLGLLAGMMVWELAAPDRRSDIPRLIRWGNNIALVVVDALVLRIALPVLAVGAAVWAQGAGVGLLNMVALPGWLAIVLALVILDLVIWAQHVAFHKLPVLWRLHRMHHADPHLDATSGLRFHPVEVLLSMVLKIGVVIAIGAPPVAVLLFEVILNGASIFNHANIRLPRGVERPLRWLLVTPEMHRIHHSDKRVEADSNYGFSVPWWDRLFGTYRAEPGPGHRFGIGAHGSTRDQWLDRLLVQPFRK